MTARIYQFPARGRFAASEQREESMLAANFSSQRVAKIVFGGAWYHEEAVEAERTNKN